MAVYKIFPKQDATIHSKFNTLNSGLDAILSLSKDGNNFERIVVQFADEDISYVKNNFINTSSYSASLQMYLADAEGIPTDYSLVANAIYEPWVMGTGRYEDLPVNTTGVSWIRTSPSTNWTTSSYPAGVTGSYTLSSPGGGSWYSTTYHTQSFSPYSIKDVDMDVSSTVYNWVSGSTPNNGFIVRISGSLETDISYNFTLNYFSRDTHTIYPPSLNLKWDDSIYTAPSGSVVSNSEVIVSTALKSAYPNSDLGSVCNVRVNVRDKFPQRVFTTGSLFTNNKYLPSSSYWSLIDHKTQDVVIDFDTQCTKISADSEGNFFRLYLNGLEPSRYYEVLIKSVIGSETVIFKNDYVFKL